MLHECDWYYGGTCGCSRQPRLLLLDPAEPELPIFGNYGEDPRLVRRTAEPSRKAPGSAQAGPQRAERVRTAKRAGSPGRMSNVQ